MKRFISCLAAAALLTTASYAQPPTSTVPDQGFRVADHPMQASSPGTVVNVAANAGQFDTLVKAIQAAGLQSTLKGDGPFTILAPTDEAFAALPESTLNALLANPDKLATILKHHVVSGEAPASTVVQSNEIQSLQGSKIDVTANGDTVMLGSARVLKTDVQADNGVIHVIDKVLIPADFDLASIE